MSPVLPIDSQLVQVDADTWVNKADISSISLVHNEHVDRVIAVIYVGRRTVSVEVPTNNLTTFIEKLQ